ncbi:MAG: peptidyl-prolyl cis-trans isomerase [Gammaproteobacteria bacterium]|nr:peptidyl-prolyl cis-trans isomerase [Gammaproteobacteria bacterium]
MTRRLFLGLKTAAFTLLMSSAVFAQSSTAPTAESTAPTTVHPQVMFETTQGNFVLELYPDKAPKTVDNFLTYVNEKFYDDTIFHRVIPNFMVQGGGFTEDMKKKPTHAPIQNEADNGLRNRIGTVAMARTNDPHSATAQFFVNVSQNSMLDFREKHGRGWGYTVFGKVIKGMKTINKIRSTKTGFKNGYKDVPMDTVMIIKARQIK